jgi:hypothetical protein
MDDNRGDGLMFVAFVALLVIVWAVAGFPVP